jgi:hypothetical protein
MRGPVHECSWQGERLRWRRVCLPGQVRNWEPALAFRCTRATTLNRPSKPSEGLGHTTRSQHPPKWKARRSARQRARRRATARVAPPSARRLRYVQRVLRRGRPPGRSGRGGRRSCSCKSDGDGGWTVVLHWELEGARERHRVDDHFTPDGPCRPPHCNLEPHETRPHLAMHMHMQMQLLTMLRVRRSSPPAAPRQPRRQRPWA